MILTYTLAEVLTLSKQNSYLGLCILVNAPTAVSFIIQLLLSSHVSLCLFIYNSWLHVDYIVASQIKYAHEWNECHNQGYTVFFYYFILKCACSIRASVKYFLPSGIFGTLTLQWTHTVCNMCRVTWAGKWKSHLGGFDRPRLSLTFKYNGIVILVMESPHSTGRNRITYWC